MLFRATNTNIDLEMTSELVRSNGITIFAVGVKDAVVSELRVS